MQICSDNSSLIGLTDEALDITEILARLQQAEGGGVGAIVPFIGVVRNNSQGQKVQALEYEAYPKMALSEMVRIAEEARYQWGVGCTIWHRTGRLTVGEASVVIAVSSPHRPEAFEAARFVIDNVKATVPVWKKEISPDGTWWVEDPLQSAAGVTAAG